MSIAIPRKLVVFDLDGCISDDRHRLHLRPEDPKGDWLPYHNAAPLDEPRNVDEVQGYINSGHRIWIITSRPVMFVAETRQWLAKRFGLAAADFLLTMRPGGDARPSPGLKAGLLAKAMTDMAMTLMARQAIVMAHDNRQDILDAYAALNIPTQLLKAYPEEPKEHTGVPGILRSMASTFEERNAVYKDNYKTVSAIMAALFPDGVPAELYHAPRFGLLEMVVGKLTRFVASDLTHADSIHDLAVYAAMIESEITKEEVAR